ncbi:MAG: glycosyltransferase family 2 protein [Planctomycetota bacterium]|jgi:glycosyltransferase involved in cell wall biosynthesis
MENNSVEKSISVSAVIPAYNCEKYIARAIESVLNQTRPVDEIIVVEDGSTDNTAEVIRSFGEKVKMIRQENAGECAARNTGIQAAMSDWIAFLDADDQWLPDKTELQVECLSQNPALVWTSSNYERCLCGQNLRRTHLPPQKAHNYLQGRTYFPEFFTAFMMEAFGCSDTMLIKKEVLLDAGLFRPNQTKGGDIDMWWRIAFRHPQIGYITKPLAVYHLGIPGCASVVFNGINIYGDMVERNLKEAFSLNRLDVFRPAVSFIMRRWIRSMLFSARKTEIRELLKRFPESFSPAYRALIYAVTVFPGLTAFGLHLASKIIRALKLRRHVTRRPPKPAF